MMKNTLIGFILIFVINTSMGQCLTTMRSVFHLIPDDTSSEIILKENYTQKSFGLSFYITQNQTGDKVYDSQQISDVIVQLNESFKKAFLNFYLSDINFINDYNCRYINNLNNCNEISVLYGHTNKINIVIVDTIIVNDFLYDGYSPKIISSVNKDHVFITPNGLMNSEIAHHIGHLFGLLDTYESGIGFELVNGSNCESTGDKICDTPADGIATDPDGRTYIPIYSNYMSIPNITRCNFTPRQVKRMHYFIQNHKTYLN